MNSRTCGHCGRALPPDSPALTCPACLLRVALLGPEITQTRHPTSSAGTTDLFPRDPFTGEATAPQQLGDYELLEQIGHGGMGVIYRARQRRLDRIVAVKLIRGGALARAETVTRFKTEAAAAARLQHANIVAIHEVGEHAGQHFYSMAFVAGQSLAEALRAGPMAPKPAAKLLQAIALAIHYAHQNAVLHRDLKPSNILLDGEGEPHVADFGLAKLLHADSSLTLSDAVIGSPNYMPPEQAGGRSAEASPASDVYSLGAILFEMLTGRPPFSAATPLETMKLVVEQEPVAPRVVNPTLPSDLETICLKCLAKEAGARYPDAGELAGELERFLADEPIRARPVSRAERVGRWCRRKPALATLAFVLAIAPIIVIAALLVSSQRVRRSAQAVAAEHEQTRANLYAADIFIAHNAVQSGNLGAAQQALALHQPLPGEADLREFEWRWLWKLSRGDALRVFQGHSNDIMSVAFSPDGRWLASGAQDGWVRLWDCESGRAGPALRAFEASPPSVRQRGHDFIRTVYTVSFSPDGKFLASCSAPMTRVWRLGETPVLVGEKNLRGRWGLFLQNGQLAVAYQWPILPTATNSAQANLIGLFDTKMQPLNEPWVVTNQMFSLSTDGRWLAAARRLDVHLWDLQAGREANSFRTPNSVGRLSLAPDGQTLAISYRDLSYVEFWNPARGESVTRLPAMETGMGWVEFSPDGKFLATTSGDETIQLWDLATKEVVRQWRGHGIGISCLAFSPDGRRLASGGLDHTVRLWEIKPPVEPPPITNAAPPLVFSPDGRWLVHGVNRSTGERVPLQTLMTSSPELTARNLESQQELLFTNSPALDLVFPPGRNGFLTATIPTNDTVAEVRFHSLADGSSVLVNRFVGEQSSTACAVLSPDGRELVTGHNDGALTWWNVATGKKLTRALAYTNAVENVRFSPKGKYLVSWTFSPREITSWDAVERVALATNEFPGPVALTFAFSPDGEQCVTGGFGNDVRRWGTRSLNLLAVLPRQRGVVHRLAWSPGGRTLAAASSDGKLIFWHVATSRRLLTALDTGGLRRRITDVAMSSNGEWCAASEDGGTLHLWHGPAE